MPRRKAIIALSVLASVIGAAVLMSPQVRPSASPQLVMPQSPLVIGEGRPGEVIRGQFRISNSGDEPLEYWLTPGCHCAQLDPDSGILPAGSEVVVHVAIRLGSIAGDTKSARIQVRTNDPARAQDVLTVMADCPAPFTVSRRSLDFGLCSPNDGTSLRVIVQTANGQRIADPESIAAIIDSAQFNAQKIHTARGDLAIDVTVTPFSECAVRTGTLTLINSNDPHQIPMTIPLRAHIVGELQVAPTTLSINSIRNTKQRLIVWGQHRTAFDEQPAIHVPDWLAIRDITENANNRRVYEVELIELPEPEQVKGAAIVISFPGIAEPLQVAIVDVGEPLRQESARGQAQRVVDRRPLE